MERCEIINLGRGNYFNEWCGPTYIHDDKNYVVKKMKPETLEINTNNIVHIRFQLL
jgi:hypothetical protein